MDDVEAVMPGFYDDPSQYQSDSASSASEQKARDEILRTFHVPDRVVRVYRPVGAYRDIKEFQSGRGIDVNHAAYVTPSEKVALEKAGPNGSVATFQTQASNLSHDGSSSLNDWSYDGPTRSNVGESDNGRINRYRG